MSQPPDQRGRALAFRLALAIIVVGGLVLLINRHFPLDFSVNNPDFARLVALIAIIVFVGAGILGRQLGVFEIVRSMAVWAAIILVVAGLYASRDQLAGFAGRLLGALAPGVPVTGRLSGEGSPDSVMITRADDGHFAVHGVVDETPLTLLVDTGASFVTLTHGDALRVGIPADELSYVVPIRTANGMIAAARIVLDKVSIGLIEREKVEALVAPKGSLAQSLLGMTFLDTLHGYAISGDRLVLTP